MDFIQEEERDFKSIFKRFRKKDFSGTEGQAIKNSTYQLSQNVVFKLGSLFFTIVIARMLLPERMGLYSLTLSTIVLLSVFSDLGIGSALITYISRMLGNKDKKKAKGYLKTLFRWKVKLLLLSSGLLVVLSYFIANYYYHKPIFFALLVGVIYIPIVSFTGFLEALFRANENFKIPLYKEIFFQVARFIIVPLTLLIFIKSDISNQAIVAIVLLAVVLSNLVSLLFLVSRAKKNVDFIKSKSNDLNKKEKKSLKRFIYPLSATALAGLFFGYIDTLMLGRVVSGAYIAYYGVAFSLVAGGSAIISFASSSLFPIFARKKGKSLENIFKKSRNAVLIISILGAAFAYSIAYWIIKIAYGTAYLSAVPLLKYFSIIIILLPVLGIYNSYFISQGRTKEIAWLLIGSTVLNIIFNLIGISYGLKVGGEMGALFGALGATILSRVFYLGGFVLLRKRK